MVDVEEMTTDLVTGESARLFAMMTVRPIVCTSARAFLISTHLHSSPSFHQHIYIHLPPSTITHTNTHTSLTGCPDGVPRVSCFADPCNSEDCDVDGAECVANFCGSCNAVWLVGDREVCQEGMLNYVIYVH